MPSAFSIGQSTRATADELSEDTDLVDSAFLATLLAMAGHDLRQPLQLITSAHDVLATMLRTKEQRQELAEAAHATAQLARMLSQLVEALHLQQRPYVSLHHGRWSSLRSWP